MTRPVFFRTQEPVSLLGLKAWLASRSDSTAAAELASSHLVATPPPSLPSSSFSSSRSEAVLAGAAPTSSSYPSSHPAVPPAARAEPPPPLPFQKLASLIASGRVDEIPVMDIEEKVVEVGVVSHTRRQMYSRNERADLVDSNLRSPRMWRYFSRGRSLGSEIRMRSVDWEEEKGKVMRCTWNIAG